MPSASFRWLDDKKWCFNLMRMTCTFGRWCKSGAGDLRGQSVLFVRDGRGAILLRYHRNFKYPYFLSWTSLFRFPVFGDVELANLLIHSRETCCLGVVRIHYPATAARSVKIDIGSDRSLLVGNTPLRCFLVRSRHAGIPMSARNMFDRRLNPTTAKSVAIP
jgi:hypothetical protein